MFWANPSMESDKSAFVMAPFSPIFSTRFQVSSFDVCLSFSSRFTKFPISAVVVDYVSFLITSHNCLTEMKPHLASQFDLRFF